MSLSTARNSIVCSFCQLKQFECGDGKCRRCHRSLGFTYIELNLSKQVFDPQSATALRREVARLMRFLRSRRGVTQAELASLTGIHRTYLSRIECGQVMPSAIALMRTARALGMDKMIVRVRNSPRSAWDAKRTNVQPVPGMC